MVVREPEPLTSQMESDCTFVAYLNAAHALYALVDVAIEGNVVVQKLFLPTARSLLYGTDSTPRSFEIF